MKNYDKLLQHAKEAQQEKQNNGMDADNEYSFISGVQTMDILERRNKKSVTENVKNALALEAVGTGMGLVTASLSGNINNLLGVTVAGAAVASATVGYSAIRKYIIGKKYSKQRNALARKYEETLAPEEELEMTR